MLEKMWPTVLCLECVEAVTAAPPDTSCGIEWQLHTTIHVKAQRCPSFGQDAEALCAGVCVLCRCAKYFVSLGVKKEHLLAVDVKVSNGLKTLPTCSPRPCTSTMTNITMCIRC